MKAEPITEVLAVELTEKETRDFALRLARETQDLEETKARRKDITAEYSATEKKHEANIGELSRKVSSGVEHREVECYWEYNWKGNLKSLIRKDTGKEVRLTDITKSDRQMKLDWDKKAKKDIKKKNPKKGATKTKAKKTAKK